MDKDLNLKTWKVDKLSEEAKLGLTGEIERKYIRSVRRKKGLKIFSAIATILLIAASGFYIHENRLSSKIANLNEMLKEEISRTEIPKFLVEFRENDQRNIDLEGYYD